MQWSGECFSDFQSESPCATAKYHENLTMLSRVRPIAKNIGDVFWDTVCIQAYLAIADALWWMWMWNNWRNFYDWESPISHRRRGRDKTRLSWAGIVEKRWSRAERGAGGRGAGTEQGAGVTEIGWSVERFFRRSRYAHTLWTTVMRPNRSAKLWNSVK